MGRNDRAIPTLHQNNFPTNVKTRSRRQSQVG
jgi:hypothetical protein